MTSLAVDRTRQAGLADSLRDDWLFAEEFARGISAVLEEGKPGEVYNFGGPSEEKNIEVVNRIVELVPGAVESLIAFVEDRPGHDRGYSLSAEKLKRESGWEAKVQFDEGMEALKS